MILLDTNVVSETMRVQPNPAVIEWLDKQAADTLYLSSITLAELRFGIGVLSAGRRKNELNQILNGIVDMFAGRILAFDADAALHHSDLAVAARAAGRGFPTPDGYIAAIAKSHNFAVATRDEAPFKAAGLNVVNPWHVQ
ncbi:type II toxin-antitoxin system VapC family toxin [Limnobacter parvus]|uniref:Ribonuclease VapC n=1 Tax=Limnobacter parvus TaxID=2939690 RepID=A0ABT1XJH0_9BURK|nr:type II toxin-antitoxin system VapC family toxin [Limnobacter parvus]MCR2747425.1 type II toxin-antitoxin system VapC family toxin [Limnobacter parvus]